MSALYTCPCCDHSTRSRRETGTGETCPDCGWVDVRIESPEVRRTLTEARDAFQLARSKHAELVASAIRSAFADVIPDGRIDLRHAIWTDYDNPNVKLPIESWDDQDRHWWEIPDAVLDGFAQRTNIFSFGNLASFRYYLPAYLSLDVRCQLGHGLRGLVKSQVLDDDDHKLQPQAVLTARQREAVRDFLRWLITYEVLDSRRDDAVRALVLWDNELPFLCSCCGYELDGPTGQGSGESCPRCGWVDIAMDSADGRKKRDVALSAWQHERRGTVGA